jgi:D-3-phosphoglycerate dehydrogenase / 2-oxoglutarate reductase
MPVNRKRLVFFERWFDPVAERILSAQDDIELVRLRYADPESDNWAALSSACGYQVGARTELLAPWFGDGSLLGRCPHLLALSSTGAGYDVIDVAACTAAGVLVVNQSGTNSEPVAEHAIGLILSLSKRIGLTNRALLRGTAHDRYAMMGNDIKGKTVGIVGIGQIGRLTAKYVAVFEMRVLAYDPYLTAEQIAERGAIKVDFATLLAESDFITVHCPRSAETIGMFSASEFAHMKPTAYFINTARGLIHKEDALLAALQAGQIAGAGIDVFDVEPPPPDHPLLHLDNVVATPHIAGATAETSHNMSKAAAEQWIDLLRGRVPPRLVNPEAWPHYSERFTSIIGHRPDGLEGAR